MPLSTTPRKRRHILPAVAALGALFGFLTHFGLLRAMDRMDIEMLIDGNPGPDQTQVGHPAPDFTLSDLEGDKRVQLARLKGRPVILSFGSIT